MGQRNIVYTGPMLNTEHGHLRPEPCVIPYGGIPSFPQPTNNHSILPPPPGNLTNFNPQHLPENHVPLPHGITQFNGVDHQLHHHHHPANNVFMTPRVFPVAINHTIQDQLPYSTIRGNFESGQLMDVFKRKSADGFPGNIQYFYPAMGASSSSVGIPMNTEGTSSSRLIPGNYGGQPLQAIPNLWLDQQFCGNGCDNAAFSWNHGPGIPYLQGPINGGGMEAANVGLHGYQVTTNTRNPTAFVHPPAVTPRQGPHNLHHPPPPPPPMQPMQGLNMDFHSQLASTSRRLPTNNTINPFQNGIESGPRFVGPAPPTGVRVYRPHRRELMIDATARNRSIPHLRVLPEDGVAILDISGYHEVGHSVDHHRDMRLDIDHMSYEELLALGEQIGSAGSGLSDDFILKYLKTRVFASSKSFESEELNSCVICQNNYEDKEEIGVLDCGHEYHVECVKKWLAVKNTCPVCKSTGLAAEAKES